MPETKTKSNVVIRKENLEKLQEQLPQMSVLSDGGKEYYRYLMSRLISSRDQKDQPHSELDDMTVDDYIERNEKRANTYIPPRKNRSDVSITSGLAREKLLSVASHIHRLNIKPEVHSFDKNKDEDTKLSRTLTNAIYKSKVLENDKEKSLLRILTMMKEGTCFVEEAWVPHVKKRKKIVDRSKLDPATGFDGLSWITQNEVLYRAESAVISTKNMLLGNLRCFDFEKQPFVATVEYRDYDEVAPLFQNWPAWKFVKPGTQHGTDIELNTRLDYGDASLYPIEENQVEIIKYQDWHNDEYQIIINGVMMLPQGFPCPWEWDGPSISEQKFEPITQHFALGKSLMAKIERDDELITQMLRIFYRKTLQSTNPPAANMTMKKLPPNLFDAGRIWNGINPQQIGKLIDHQGVNANEWQMFEKVREFIDSKSISRIAQGQQPSRSATATEILELQKQAQIAIGLALFAYGNLEKKMAEKRLPNLLTNWSKAESEEWDDTKKAMKKRYKSIEIQNANFGGDMGTEKLIFTDKEYSHKEVHEMSRRMFVEEGKHADKKRTTIISIPMLRRLKYTHHITVSPSEDESDNLNKILFQEEFSQAMQFFGPQEINIDYYKRKFAKVWGNDPLDVFNQFGVDQLAALTEGMGGKGDEPQKKEGFEESGSPIANAGPSADQASGKEGVDRQQQRNKLKAEGARLNR
jgi:hypothetical protein